MADESEQYLSVGQMAKLNGVSAKTLHIYQEKGILIPEYVDEKTGYRYYSPVQHPVLDAVTQLKNLGFSLEEIKECLTEKDPASLREKVLEKMALLRQREFDLKVAESAARHLLGVCSIVRDKPICDQVILEELPPRRALVFDVDPVGPDDVKNAQWEAAYRSVHQQLIRRMGDARLFRGLTGFVSQDSLEDGSLVHQQVCLIVDDDVAEFLDDVYTIPGGQYLTMYKDGALLEDGSIVTYPALRTLLDYARDHGFIVNGDYYGETIAFTPALSYESADSFFRLCLPVTRGDA